LYLPIEFIIGLLATVPYWPLLFVCNVPLYDDGPIISEKIEMHKGQSWKEIVKRAFIGDRGFSWLTIQLNRHLRIERGWLGLNLLVHAAFTVILFHIGLMFLDPFYAGLGALAAAYHPGGVMAVTQVALGRPSMICAVFLLCGVIAPWWAILPMTAIAWKFKEEAWAMPGVILLSSVALIW